MLYSFAGGNSDGASPGAALVQTTDGNFCGTTTDGGASGGGTAFRITPTGTETLLHSFAGGPTDGAAPAANLIQGSDGNLFGTTGYGGGTGLGGLLFNDGTVFKVRLH